MKNFSFPRSTLEPCLEPCCNSSPCLDPCLNLTSPCPFRIINGACLATIGVLGVVLSLSVVGMLASRLVKLPERKSLFILNVATNDVFLSILGILRGVGLAKNLVSYKDHHGEPTLTCQIYAVVSSLFKNNLSWVLIPLTVDRFVAVVFPTRYTAWMTRRACILLIATPWTLLILLNIYDIITVMTGYIKLEYNPYQHKCMYNEQRKRIEPLVLLLVPMVAICFLYLAMFTVILRHKIKSSRFFISTSAIILTGLLSTVPEILISTFEVKTSYEVFMIFGVTFFYINGVCNPLIYLGSHQKFQRQMLTSQL
ncbi:hypothetical protein ACHWQZ_G008752 [Mnemiopsis leidyi]